MTIETVVAQTGVVMPCSGSGWKARTTAKNAIQPPARRAPGNEGGSGAPPASRPGSPSAGAVQSSSSACSSSVRSRVVGTMAYLPRVAFDLG